MTPGKAVNAVVVSMLNSRNISPVSRFDSGSIRVLIKVIAVIVVPLSGRIGVGTLILSKL